MSPTQRWRSPVEKIMGRRAAEKSLLLQGWTGRTFCLHPCNFYFEKYKENKTDPFPLGILCCQDHLNVPSNWCGRDRSYLSIQGILLSDHRGRKAISTMRSEWGSPNQMARIPQKHYRCSQEIKPGGNNTAVRTVAVLLDIQHSMAWSLLELAHSSLPSFVPFFDPSYFLPGSISIGPFFF